MQFVNSHRTGAVEATRCRQSVSRLTRKMAAAATFLSFILVLLLWGASARGGDKRDFVAFYEVKRVADLGAEVRVSLNLRLRNSSATDVADATLTLRGRPEPVKSFGSFPSVSVRAGQSVLLSGEFTIPRHEFRRWQRHLGPGLLLEFKDAAGNLVRRTIHVEEED